MSLATRFALLAVIAPLWAQDATVTLAGTVVNARTGEPVRRALLELIPLRDRAGVDGFHPETSPRIPELAFSDAAGAFRISGIPVGKYRLVARKPEFTQDVDSRDLSLTLEESREGVLVSLMPLGVIEGKVVDQDGQPLRGINIVALTRNVQDGRRVSRQYRSVSSDDRGMYRLWNIPPGKYYLKAAGRAAGTAVYVGQMGRDMSTSEGFAPIYFGGAAAIETAAPLNIEPGSDEQADFRIAMQPAYKIRGTLVNFARDKAVRFELFLGNEEVSSGRAALNGSTGRFEIPDIVPGAYKLIATQQGLRAEEIVNISGSDVNGLVMALAGGVNVSVAIGGAVQPTERGQTREGREFARPAFNCQAELLGAGSASNHVVNAPYQTAFSNVPPGEYFFSIQCFGVYVESAMSGNVDLLAHPEIAIQAGVAPSPIEVRVKQGGGTLHATIGIEHPPAQVWVLLVPQSGAVVPQLRPTWRNPAHETEFANLPPGDYSVYAFSNGEVEFRNPEFLRSLTGGTSAKIEAGGKQEISVKSLVR